jgi:undecaprenyl-diphosphatase
VTQVDLERRPWWQPLPELDHPVRAALIALGALAGSSAIARLDDVPQWELRLTEAINAAPDAVAVVLWPVMQLGSTAGPFIAAGYLAWRRRAYVYGAVTLAVGELVWLLAKVVKESFGRGRPLAYLPEINVREGTGEGLGFISGHSAVAATCAVLVAAVLPPGRRWIPVALAGIVGVSRIVYGMHLPADVVGGWSFGALAGIATVAGYRAVASRFATRSTRLASGSTSG